MSNEPRLWSHPTRVRGLKPTRPPARARGGPSHPTRVRGLKRFVEQFVDLGAGVAPHAGAWIETPATGRRLSGRPSSHPTRVRGLKLAEHDRSPLDDGVAPHAGAWIETVPSRQR